PRIAASGDANAYPIGNPSRVPIRCVIVDDNSFFLDGAADLLRREGMDVVGIASNGVDAIRLVEELRPDVTLVSTHSEEDLADLIAASPALGFVPKTRLSAKTILDTLERAA